MFACGADPPGELSVSAAMSRPSTSGVRLATSPLCGRFRRPAVAATPPHAPGAACRHPAAWWNLRPVTWIAIPFGALAFFSTLLGGLLALRLRRELTTLIALSGGIVLAVSLFDVLPEALAAVDDPERVMTLVGIGFLAFFLAERGLVLHHRDEEAEARAHAQVGALGAAGLSAHSFADGLNTVSFILRQGGEQRRAVTWLAVDAIAPVVGAVVGAALSVSEDTLGHFLALYAGFFLYMGATDLLPEAHTHPSGKRVALTVAGFGATWALARVAIG